MSSADALRPELDRIEGRAWVVGGAGLLLCLLAGWLWPARFFPSYLTAFVFWVGIALGCMALTMLHHLVGGAWGVMIRRPLESGAMMLLPLALLFLPILLDLSALYEWARPDVVAHDPLLRYKSAYLNPTGFISRTVGYFTVWIFMAFLLNLWSGQQDRTDDLAPTRRLQAMSGPGLLVLVLTSSLSSVDWIMSLEPHWYSTIFGIMLITGQGLATFAAMLLVARWLSHYEPTASVATKGRFQDLGNLMLAFVMLWAYTSFSQFLIIWSGNLAEEIPWYLKRTRGGWQYVALSLVLFHFFLPFAVLLFRDVKRGGRMLFVAAGGIVVMHLVDLVWLIFPAPLRVGSHGSHEATAAEVFRSNTGPELLILLPAVAGIGGICVAFFLRHLKGRPLVALNDPATIAAAEHAHDHHDEDDEDEGEHIA